MINDLPSLRTEDTKNITTDEEMSKTKRIEPITLIYPDLGSRLKRSYAAMMTKYKISMRCNIGMRTFDQQDQIYAQGRTQSGPIVTYARAGESFHNFGCGADSCFLGIDPYLNQATRGAFLWSEFGRYAKSFGLVWGGDWHPPKQDRPHVELAYGLTLEAVQELHTRGGVEAVWLEFDRLRGVEPGEGWKKS